MTTRIKRRTDTATNRESDKIIVRLPDGMRARLADLAARRGRSVTAEVVSALITHLAYDGEIPIDKNRTEDARPVVEAAIRVEVRRLFEIMKEEAINTGYLPPGAKVPPMPPDIPSPWAAKNPSLFSPPTTASGAERQSKKKPATE
jgi:hypothetical protein